MGYTDKDKRRRRRMRNLVAKELREGKYRQRIRTTRKKELLEEAILQDDLMDDYFNGEEETDNSVSETPSSG